MKKSKMILRTKTADRFTHWIVAICFFLVSLSGLSMFFPSLKWITETFGTPQLGRILHPFLGVVIFVALCFMFVRFVKYNILHKSDKEWFANMGDVIRGKDEKELPVGKYNPGQKLMFWGIMGLMLIMLFSGVIIWQPYFAPLFTIPLVRIALLVHATAGIGLIILILGHIYMAFWVKGSIPGMIDGKVSRKWAKKHHPLWYKDVLNEEQQTQEEKHR